VKQGDMVRFVEPDHTSYHALKDLVGIIMSVERVWRPAGDEYLGSKVIAAFGEKKPRAFTEYSLEVANEDR
jgi:hypothetical protein